MKERLENILFARQMRKAGRNAGNSLTQYWSPIHSNQYIGPFPLITSFLSTLTRKSLLLYFVHKGIVSENVQRCVVFLIISPKQGISLVLSIIKKKSFLSFPHNKENPCFYSIHKGIESFSMLTTFFAVLSSTETPLLLNI